MSGTSKSMKSLLGAIWRSLSPEGGEVNLQLMIGHWAPVEEVIRYSSKAVGDRGSKSSEKRKVHGIWERVSRASLIPPGYSGLYEAVRSIPPPEGYSKIEEVLRTKTRLIVGGGLTGWEVSMVRLLRPYSVPWIPGSGLKGALRAAASEIGDPKIERACGKLFGNKEERGKLICLGGFVEPGQKRVITVDIVSPHYKAYYEGGAGGKQEYPHEYLQPVPVRFPVVRENVSFLFVLMAPSDLREEVRKLLIYTLTEHGIGGKRSAGYGLFESVESGGP